MTSTESGSSTKKLVIKRNNYVPPKLGGLGSVPVTRGLDNLSDDEKSRVAADEPLDEVDARMPSRRGWEALEYSHQPPVVGRDRVINIMQLKETPKASKLRGSSQLTLQKNQGFFAGDQEEFVRKQDIQIEE